MKRPILYRKRLIPEECILLKDDELLYRDEKKIITRWNTLRPKKDLHHGFSCYFLDKGIKVSKFYKADGSLICWYCDIVAHSYDKATDTYVFTDLLADVLVYPDGRVKVVDLDELSEANETGLLSLDDPDSINLSYYKRKSPHQEFVEYDSLTLVRNDERSVSHEKTNPVPQTPHS